MKYKRPWIISVITLAIAYSSYGCIATDMTQQLHALLNQLQVKNEFNQFPGTHSWQYWRDHLADSLAFVGQRFRSFAQE